MRRASATVDGDSTRTINGGDRCLSHRRLSRSQRGAPPIWRRRAILEARGHAEIEARAAGVHEHWVGSEGLSFRGCGDADRLDDLVKLHWEGVAGDGTVLAVGLSVLVLAADGRIERDYTFIVG